MAVFVLDKQKKPLMPCTEKHARLLLERGRAVVVRLAPFTMLQRADSYGYTFNLTPTEDARRAA